MSTPEQPRVEKLTRKQLREIRMTGATPIITADDAAPTDPDADSSAESAPSIDGASADSPSPASAPLPRAAEPVHTSAPRRDSQVDLGVAPLTRRQAREQERIRTASVPVITPDTVLPTATEPDPSADVSHAADTVEAVPVEESVAAAGDEVSAAADLTADPAASDREEPEQAPVIGAAFGLDVAEQQPPHAPTSFDELIVRKSTSTGSMATSNALILSQIPESPSLVGPVAATGEVLVTGSLNFDGVGSRGHSPGAADGHEADAVLVDGELPSHSSPTPISASAAVSTAKVAGEIIRPPEPEKNSRLMLMLAIAAGVLAVALVGVLIVAFVTGVFG